MNLENANKLKGYLKQEAAKKNMHSNYAYTYFFIRDFLSKVTNTDITEFTIKGSLALLANNKKLIRPITDIDLTSENSIIDSSYAIEKTTKIEDKIKYKLRSKFVTTNDTVNFKILCKFDTIEHMIKIDLKRENRGNVVIREMPQIFKKDNLFDISTLSLEEIVGNKIYMILKSQSAHINEDKEIRRTKDFYDLFSIIKSNNYNHELARLYFLENMLEYGKIDNLKEVLSSLDSEFILKNKSIYQNDQKKLGYDESLIFDEIVNTTKNEIERRIR